MSFIITIILILSVQLSFFSSFNTFIEGSPLDKKHIASLERQVQSAHVEVAAAELKLASLTQKQKRGIASIEKIDMSEFHFSRAGEFKKSKKFELALAELDKVLEESTNPNYLARAEFEKTQLICFRNIEEACVGQIDAMVTQFPETPWAGRSILILTDYYFRQNRPVEGRSLLKIIKKDFMQFDDLAAEVKSIEKRYL